MMESQKSIEDIVKIESFSYTEDHYPFFKYTGLSKESMQNYVIVFFFTVLNKLMSENMIEIKGRVLKDG